MENGSGKSTLLFILMGLLQPLSGKVLINGKRIKNWNKVIQSDMSFVDQTHLF